MEQSGAESRLLERATRAIEGIDRTEARQARAFERQEKAFDRQARAFERQEGAFDRHAQAFDRQAKAFERQEQVLEQLIREGRDERAEARRRDEQMMNRFAGSERIFIEAMSEISAEIRQNTARLDDMGDAIRANTRAVLSALDRFGPGP